MQIAPKAPPPPRAPGAAAARAAPRRAATAALAAPAPGGAGGRRARFLALWAAAVALPLLGFVLGALAAWHAVRAEAEVRLWRTLDVMQEHALRAFQTQEVILTATDAALLGRGWEEIALSEDVFGLLTRLETSAPSIYGIALVGPDGRLAATSRGPFPAPRVDLTDREYVRVHRAGRAGAFVTATFVTRPSNTRVFGISRGRTGEDGRPDGGSIASSFTPEHFTGFYETLAEGRDDSLSLVREDGALLARRPPPPPAVGEGPRPDGFLTRAWRAAAPAGADRGALEVPVTLDGVARRIGFRRVGDYPVYVTYGQSAADLRAAWARRLPPIALVCGGAAALLLALTGLARQAAARESAALAAAAAQAAQARAEAEARADAEARLRQAERVGALGQVAAGIAHDFNNLVQSVAAASRLLARRAGEAAEVRRLAAMLGDSAARGARVVHRMLDYARREVGEGGEHFEPAPALARLEGLLAGVLGPGIALRVERPAGDLPPVQGDRAELETVLLNLVGNARDALPAEGGEIRIAAAAACAPSPAAAADGVALSPGGYLRIAVSDTGAGMPPEVLSRVGEPFFTTKPAGKGTGLGLSLARRFAERAGGALHVASRAGEGTTVALWLREAPSGAGPAAAAERRPADPVSG